METISITVISTLVAIIATMYTMQRNVKSDVKQDASNNVSMKEEIKYISKGVDEIKYDTKSLNLAFSAINERMGRNEERLNNLEKKVDHHIDKHA